MGDSIFRRLWGEVLPEGQHLLVWTMPNKASIWCSSIAAAEEAAALWAERGMEVYFGIGLVDDPDAISQRKGVQRNHIRGDASDITYIPAVWADVDDLSVLEWLIKEQPTFVVNSGHGYHAYWVFGDLVHVNGDRSKWEAIIAGWQAELGRRLGLRLDAAWDLARVLRVPGSTNYKTTPHMPVEYVEGGGWLYDPEDFEPYAKTERHTNGGASDDEIYINEQPHLDGLKWEALRESDTRVQLTWERKRKDLPSQSEHDQALANFAAWAGWSAQEIADLLVAFRKKHGEPIKHAGYFEKTVRKAIADARVNNTSDDTSPEDILEHLSSIWEVEIERFVKYPGDTTIYELHLAGAEPIVIGTIEALLKQERVRGAVADRAACIIPRQKNRDWERQLQALLKAAETATVGVEANEKANITELLNLYLEHRAPISDKDEAESYNDAVFSRDPIRKDGDAYVTTSKFAWWLKMDYGSNQSAGEIARIFSRLGMAQVTVMTAGRARRTSRTYWRVHDA